MAYLIHYDKKIADEQGLPSPFWICGVRFAFGSTEVSGEKYARLVVNSVYKKLVADKAFVNLSVAEEPDPEPEPEPEPVKKKSTRKKVVEPEVVVPVVNIAPVVSEED